MEQTKAGNAPYLLRLEGSPRQIGQTHGAAARNTGALGCIGLYGSMLDAVFGFQARGPIERAVRKGLRRFVGETAEREFIERLPARYRRTMEGFSEGSGLPLSLLLRASVMPDLYTYLLARKYRFSPPVEIGCTGIVTRRGGRLLHGRNLDFPDGKAWTDFPTVIEYVPDDGQRYASVTTLGVETAGVTAMNEAGITLSLNMNYSTSVSTGAVPITAVGHEMMRQAVSLDSAAAILERFPRGGGWSFLISSHREGNAFAAEFDSGKLSLKYMKEDDLVRTNHYEDPELKSREYWITKGRKLDTRARREKAETLLKKIAGKAAPADLIRILRNNETPYLPAERAYGYSISQVHTLSSAVFDPAARKVYVAGGGLPAAKQDFHAFDLFPGPVKTGEIVTGESGGAANEARREYALAHHDYFPANDLPSAAAHLEKAAALHPVENLYGSMLALVQLKRKKTDEARLAMEQAMENDDMPYRRTFNRLFYARILDLSGRRAEAIENYRRVLAEGDPYFYPRARRGIRAPWTWRKAESFVIDFMLGDAIEV